MSVILRRISELVVVPNHSDFCVYCPPVWRGGGVNFHILSCWFIMSAILRRIREVEVQYRNILYLFIGLANQHDRKWHSPPPNSHWYRTIRNVGTGFWKVPTQHTSPVQKCMFFSSFFAVANFESWTWKLVIFWHAA